jgi:hypothetical protein
VEGRSVHRDLGRSDFAARSEKDTVGLDSAVEARSAVAEDFAAQPPFAGGTKRQRTLSRNDKVCLAFHPLPFHHVGCVT